MGRSKLPPDLASYVTERPDTGCLLWAGVWGRHDPGKYGRVTRDGRTWPAHALAWVYANKRPVPAGLIVCHTCDVPSCINPDHLWVGTAADNAQDKVKKGRQAKGKQHGRFNRGELQWGARLKESDVREIRQSSEAPATLARLYNVSPQNIGNVRKGRTWKHLLEAA